MLALSRDHAENPVEVYIVQAIEAHNFFFRASFMLVNYITFLKGLVHDNAHV